VAVAGGEGVEGAIWEGEAAGQEGVAGTIEKSIEEVARSGVRKVGGGGLVC